MTYKDGKLTVGRGMYKTYTTSWAGWAHYWGSTDQNGIKMHIHAADPRMSTTTGKHGKIDPVGTDEIDPVKTA